MADKWLELTYPEGDADHQWFPDNLGDKEIIRIHHIEVNWRWPNAVSPIQHYFNFVIMDAPTIPIPAAPGWPSAYVREYGDRILVAIMPHLNWRTGTGDGLMLAHEQYHSPFPVPRDTLGVGLMYRGTYRHIFWIGVRINYERLTIREDDYELMLARNPWKMNSRAPTDQVVGL